ncbi:hypothetical protein PAXRUDRAFT_822300 [Paxillus rubicundulus Ve08.2h10]|uniref:AN1-type domain-containing protein n=1 Tax=Paxillus rubicundulus Ve08.2h10 TaxID=930991 RepID=A0A0D0DWQ9_9AGAM|nr:hypothetical protein PAXRUDRAFT_822300 [Paxillus rubicundulus Ve08.2h10]
MSSTANANSDRDAQLLSVGRQCSESSCLLVDFLPFKCQHCSQSFCGEHFLVTAHRCPKYDESKYNRVAPSCPLCNSPVAIPQGEDPNIRVERHILTECSVMTGKSGRSRSQPVCARGKCGKVLYAPIGCNDCHKQYCPQHRFPKDHGCSSLPSGATSSRKPQNALSSARIGLNFKAPVRKPIAQTFKAGRSSTSSPPTPMSGSSISSNLPPISNPFSKPDRASSVPTDTSTSSTSSQPTSPTPSPASTTYRESTLNSRTAKLWLDPLSFVPPSIFATA